MAGPDPGDPASRSMALGDPGAVRPDRIVVYPIESPGRIGVRASVKQGVRDATGALVAAGARVGEAKLSGLAKAFEIWAAMLSEVSEQTYDDILTDGQERDRIPVLTELLKLAVGRSPHTFPALAVAGLEKIVKRFEGPRGRLVAEGRALGAEIEALLGDEGVLVYPVYSRPAPRHVDALRTPLDAACTAIFNVLELPSTVVPVGFESRGLPIAVQIVGARGRDHLTIAAASIVERELGGWERATPPGVD
jgi:fatty acid amide hydrolase 2